MVSHTSYNHDTSIEMQEYQYKLIMSKSPGDRFLMAVEMSEEGRELMLAGIRHDKPNLSDDEYRLEILKRLAMQDKSLEWLIQSLNLLD